MFSQDHIIRDVTGRPLGRMVLVGDYDKGADTLQVTVLKVPLEFNLRIPGMVFYIDGVQYKVSDVSTIRLNQRGKDWVASSFIAEKVK